MRWWKKYRKEKIKKGKKWKKGKKEKIEKGKSKKSEKSEKRKIQKNPKEKKKEFAFSSPGQNMRILSLPYSWFSAICKEGQLYTPNFVRTIVFFFGPWAHLRHGLNLGLEPCPFLFYQVIESLCISYFISCSFRI